MSDDLAAALAAIPAGRRQPSTPCHTCSLPPDVLDIVEADRGSANPHSFAQLSRFLATKGHPVGEAALGHHFRKGHQTR